MVHLKGRTAIVTGANKGIGLETAKGLSRANHILVMACRDMQKGEKAREQIISETGNKKVFLFGLDLTSFACIREFCLRIKKQFKQADILINNAGIFCTEYSRTQDNLEMTMGVNFFGTFLLTNLLLPLFKSSPDARIVNVSSNSYKTGRFNINTLETRNSKGLTAYSASKRALILFTYELAERLKSTAIAVNAVHPGHVRTDIWRFPRWYAGIVRTIMSPSMINAEQGARPLLHLALSESVKGITGKYFDKLKAKSLSLENKALQCALWEKAVQITGI